jgi:hypothetical protein
MLVIAMETQSSPPGQLRWTARRHDDDESDATSGASAAELFDTVFHALHDGEQVALGFDCPLTLPVASGRAGPDSADDLAKQAGDRPGIAELTELPKRNRPTEPWSTWRPRPRAGPGYSSTRPSSPDQPSRSPWRPTYLRLTKQIGLALLASIASRPLWPVPRGDA